MKNLLILLSVFILSGQQILSAQETDEQKIINACTNYVDGAYSADGDKMMKGLHPELNKAIIEHIPSIKRSFLRKTRTSQLKAVVNARSAFLEESKRSIEVKVLDIDQGIASAVVISTRFIDYCHLIKSADEWQIVNVLWTWTEGNQPARFKQEEGPLTEEMIKNAAMDYIDGAYSGNADRMERALHPELNKVYPILIPNSEQPFLSISGYEMLVEMTRAQVMNVDEGKRNIDYKLLDHSGNLATVKAASVNYIDYCQIGLVNGEAKIINVLWRPNR